MTKKALILVGFIVLKFLIQYTLISPEYDLQRDEYLHLDLGHHLAWGYLSVPPFTAWTSKIIYLLGNSVFWVKFFPSLYGALTILVVWKAIEELKGNLFALILGATCVLFSALLRLNTLYQPNSFDVLSWTTFYFVIIKYFNSGKPKWLFIGAIVFALGFLNKYNIAFLLIAMIPAILLTQQRKIFAQKKLYLAMFFGLFLIAPNLLWQYNNNFPIIQHLNELSETQLVNVDRIGFIKSQLLFFIGSLFVIISALYALLFYKPFRKYAAFFWTFFFTLIAFLYFKAKDYYAIGLYPVYISFGSVFLANILNRGWKKYLQPIAIAVPVLIFIPIFNIAFPNKSPEYIIEHSKKYKDLGLLRWEDGKDHSLPQDYADMLGWQELAKKVDSVYITMPNPDQTLILCDNYGQAGAINYYTKEGIKAVSFNADYINWFNLDQHYINLIRVKNYKEKDNEFSETGPYFESAVLADSITNQYAREYRTIIFAFTKAKIDVNERIKIEIEEVKNYR
ncbi:MAG: glycosyl transferase [Bacteroidetes bacterium MedPE-SWsnd-G2]|nr:MAG: glycosyl transferase [Bacteroidetes bacterium MedPE-SWsnd-G2]